MIIAKNRVLIPDGYSPSSTFPMDSPIGKLRLWVETNDVIIQISEDSENTPPHFDNATDTEILCPKGFHSFVPLTMWTSMRFKNNIAGQVAQISFVGYA